MPEQMKHLLSRKFLATLATLASAHYLVLHGHIADGVYSAVVIAAIGGFLTANVVQKATTKDTK